MLACDIAWLRFMVISELEYGQGQIILQPNRSASWPTNKRVIVSLGAATMIIAVSWSLAGVWMVLPFAGLEIGLLSYFLIRVSHTIRQQQVIRITSERICIDTDRWRQTQQWISARAQTHVVIIKPRHSLDGPSFLLCEAETSIRLGDFLNKEDREALRSLLLSLGLRVITREPEPDSHLDA